MTALALLPLLLSGLGPELTLQPLGPEARAGGEVWGSASVASDGVDFMVTWTDNRLGTQSSVWAARISVATGALLDHRNILVSALFGGSPRIAFSGGRYLVAWEDRESTYYRVMLPDGRWAPGSELPRALGYGLCPEVVGSPDGGFIIAARRDSLDALWLDSNGTPAQPPLQLSAGPAPYGTCVRIQPNAVRGDHFLAVWREGVDLIGRTVRLDGTAASLPVTLTTASASVQLWDVTAESTSFAAVYRRDGVSYRQWVSDDGVPSGLAQPLDSADAGVIDLRLLGGSPPSQVTAYGQDGTGGVWGARWDAGATALCAKGYDLDLAASGNTVLFTGLCDQVSLAARRFTRDFTPLDPDAGLVNVAPGQHRWLQVTRADDGTFFAAWNRVTPTAAEVFGVRLDPALGVVGSAIQLDEGNDAYAPTLAFHQGTFWVLWSDFGGRKHLRPVSKAGVPGPAFELAFGGGDEWLTTLGSSLVLLTYREPIDEGYLTVIYPDGGQTDRRLTFTADKDSRLRLAESDAGALLVWQGKRLGNDSEVYGGRLAADGTPLDADGGFLISFPNQSSFGPEVADDGQGGFIVAFHTYQYVYAARVVGTSVSAPVALTMNYSQGAAVAPVPGGVLVSWADIYGGDVRARLVVPYGPGIDAGALVTVTEPSTFEHLPRMTVGGGHVLFGYAQLDAPAGAMTVKARFLYGQGPGSACAEAWQCQSGRCEVGACVGGVAPPDVAVRRLRVGCGCDGAGLAPLIALAGLLLRGRRRRQGNEEE